MEVSLQDLLVDHPSEKDNLRKIDANCAGGAIPLHVSSMGESPPANTHCENCKQGLHSKSICVEKIDGNNQSKKEPESKSRSNSPFPINKNLN